MSLEVVELPYSVDENKPKVVEAENKGWSDTAYNRMSQDEADYEVLGGTNERACAACRWFVSPDSCTLVHGDINSGGICAYYMAKQDAVTEPIPVVVVPAVMDKSAEGGSAEGAVAFLQVDGDIRDGPVIALPDISNKSILGRIKSMLGLREPGKAFSYAKDADGNYRFFVIASNNFKDKHKEIITQKAHEGFVKWCDDNASYPELWLWHAKGSRIGEVDWIDCANGVLCASGLIDATSINRVKALGNEALGVSHGFLGVTTKAGHITDYRSYEMSVLPIAHAANVWTGVNFLKEIGMPFSEAKKKWLSEKATPEQVESWEKESDELSDNLKALGVEYKEVETDDIRNELAAVTKAVGDLAGVVAAQAAAQVASNSKALEANSKSIAERVEEAQVSRIKEGEVTGSVVPSESPNNAPATPVNPQSYDWFDDKVMGGIFK